MNRRRAIKDFPGYEVDIYGNVWSCFTRGGRGSRKLTDEWRKLFPHKNSHGYTSVMLCKDGKRFGKRVNRLVLETFIGQCSEAMQSCHKNGIRDDNRLENLRWDTAMNNNADKKLHGTWQFGASHPRVKLNEKQVRVIKHILNIPNRMTHQQIGEIFNVHKSAIGLIAIGRTWKHITIQK